MLTRPSTYRLVSWPTRIVICIIALGAAWLVVKNTRRGIALYDLDTGEVLYARNPDMRLLPASTTKLMTALGERNAAAEAAALRAKQKPVEDPGEPGVIYLKMPPPATAPPPRHP